MPQPGNIICETSLLSKKEVLPNTSLTTNAKLKLHIKRIIFIITVTIVTIINPGIWRYNVKAQPRSHAMEVNNKTPLITNTSFARLSDATQNIHPKINDVAVVADAFVVLYIGIDNPISVVGCSASLKGMHLSISNGSISGSNGYYMAHVTKEGTARIKILGKPSKSWLFRVRRLPNPTAQFGGLSGGTASAVNLKGQDVLLVNYYEAYFGFDAHFSVKSFTLVIATPGEGPIILVGTGTQLTEEMMDAKSRIIPGSLLIFKDIIVGFPDGVSRPIRSMVLEAK